MGPAQNHDPLPDCTAGDAAVIGGEAVGGAATLGIGVSTLPPTLGGSVPLIIAGLTGIGAALNEISKCG
jgi:hypothetical protein